MKKKLSLCKNYHEFSTVGFQFFKNKKNRHALNFYRLSRISSILDDVSLAHFPSYYDLVQLNNKFDAHLADDEEEKSFNFTTYSTKLLSFSCA